jgi:putative nucleotidyltransferase with HDIG domain
MANILLVDDEIQMLRLLEQTLARDEHTCALAKSAAEARKLLKSQTFELVVCDVNIPGESGTDLASFIGSEYRDTAVVIVTAADDPKTVEAAIDSGTYGYILKPFNANELIINVRNILRRRKLEIANRMYRQDLEKMVVERTGKLEKALSGIIQVIVRMAEARDPYTAGHQKRVASLAVAIARDLGVSQKELEGIQVAGMIHDLGKISVPAEILSKPTILTDIEIALIRTHPKSGYQIMEDIDFPWAVGKIVLQHHEKMDGSGYPDGIKGEDILQEARIICVADVVEAMASHRPYRPALGIDAALDEISTNRGKLYDPAVVDSCLKIFWDGNFTFEQ